MKKSLTIGIVVTLLAVSGTLLAQSYSSNSLITQMKEGLKTFTLSWDLNAGQTGLTSSPLTGKRTGDMLTASEYNRLLEIVSQGGTTVGGSGNGNFGGMFTRNSSGTCDEVNPFTNSCSCPSGYTNSIIANAVSGGEQYFHMCWNNVGGSGGGLSSWVNVSLTDTADFDNKCDYLINTADGGSLRATFVHPTIIGFIKNEFDANSAASWYGVRKTNKSTLISHQDNWSNNIIYPNITVTSITKNCGSGGSGGGSSTGNGVLKTCYVPRSTIMSQTGGNYHSACTNISGGGWTFTGTFMTGQYGDTAAAMCSKIVYDGSSNNGVATVCGS